MKKTKLILKACFILGLVAVLLIGSLNLFYVDKKQSITSSVRPGEVITTPGDVMDASGNKLVSGKVYAMSSNMTFSSPSTYSNTAPDGVIVEAVVKPAQLKNKAVDWHLFWRNSNSDFSDFKVSDFVSITPIDDNKVQVECLNSFSEQILLVASSRLDSTKIATCVIDYVGRVYSFVLKSTDSNGKVQNFSLSNSFTWTWPLFSQDNPFDFFCGFEVLQSSGTLVPTDYKLSYTRTFSKCYEDIILDCINSPEFLEVFESVELVFGEQLSSDEKVSGDALDWFDLLARGESANLLDCIYLRGLAKVDGEIHYEHLFLGDWYVLDLIREEYLVNVNNGNEVPLMTLSFYYEDAYQNFSVENIEIYLSEDALIFSDNVQVDLDNSNVVL